MDKRELEKLLADVASGSVSPDDAVARIQVAPLADLGYARVDAQRGVRQGVSEVIYGEGKTADQIAGIVASMLGSGQERVLITRLSADKAREVEELLSEGLSFAPGEQGDAADAPSPSGAADAGERLAQALKAGAESASEAADAGRAIMADARKSVADAGRSAASAVAGAAVSVAKAAASAVSDATDRANAAAGRPVNVEPVEASEAAGAPDDAVASSDDEACGSAGDSEAAADAARERGVDAEAASEEAADAVPELPVFTYYDLPRVATVGEAPEPDGRGTVLVVTGGTSDIPVAEEAVLTAEMLGNRVERVYDVGVAGIHRLLARAEDLERATVIVAVAGMEGALASVVGGLASCPVIAVPTSVGYGASFGGVSALLAMLNSCASGVSVVNIDNGFGAGYQASMINHVR